MSKECAKKDRHLKKMVGYREDEKILNKLKYIAYKNDMSVTELISTLVVKTIENYEYNYGTILDSEVEEALNRNRKHK